MWSGTYGDLQRALYGPVREEHTTQLKQLAEDVVQPQVGLFDLLVKFLLQHRREIQHAYDQRFSSVHLYAMDDDQSSLPFYNAFKYAGDDERNQALILLKQAHAFYGGVSMTMQREDRYCTKVRVTLVFPCANRT